MALKRFTRSFSVVMALLAWLCLGVALPIVMSLYSADIVTDMLEAAPSDAFTITEPVVLSDAPLIRVERGTIAIVDGNGRPIANAAPGTLAGTGPASPGQHVRLFNATISLAGALASTVAGITPPTQATQPEALAPFVEALAAGRYETLSLRRTTIVANVLGEGAKTITEVKADISLRRRGTVAIKGSGLLRGLSMTFEATASPALLDRSRPGAPSMPLKLALKGSFVDLAFDGRLMLAPGEIGLQGPGELSMPSGRQVARLFGAQWPVGAGLRDLAIRGQMTMTQQSLAFENASARMDGNEATGVLAIKLSHPRPVVTGTLAYKSFDTKPYMSSPVREFGDTLTWSSFASGALLTVPLGLHLDADLRLSADKVLLGSVEFGRSAATIALKDGRVLADLANLKFNGGEGGGQVTADFTGFQPKVTVRGKLDEVDLGRLSTSIVGLPLLQGRAGIVADLTGTGQTLQDVLHGLAGKIAVQSQDAGRLGGDLRGLVGAAREQETTGWAAAARGSTAFDRLDLRLVLRDGVLLTETAEARSGASIWSATGVVNLLTDRIDVRLSQGPTTAGSARIGVLEINGPLLRPKIKAATEP